MPGEHGVDVEEVAARCKELVLEELLRDRRLRRRGCFWLL